MKTIGIKLADGSFYPVLEDNTPSEKKLELTTAHNNQTKVMVDLYRSATCSMDDAEYVDSLQIENLTARPNGETDIKFSISLDEDNQLSAKIVDPETGNESNTTITLVSRTLEERLITDDYDINDSEESVGKGAKVAGAVAAGGLLAAAAAMAMKNSDETEETETEEVVEDVATDETVEAEDTIEESDFSLDETAVDEPVIEEPAEEIVDETVEEPAAEVEEPVVEENADEVVEDAEFSEDVVEAETTEDAGLPDMDFDIPEENSDETLVTEDSSLPDMDFDLPDDTATDETIVEDTSDETFAADTSDDTIISDETITTDETVTSDSDEDFIEEDSGLPDMDFDIPDDTSDSTDVDFGTENETENSDFPDDFFNTEDDMKDPTFDTETPAAGGLNFDGLYDEETERGTPAQTDEDDVKKKTKVPVIICIICAIICIIATALILFIIPSKYNLITKKNAKNADTTVTVAEQSAPEPSPAPIAEPEPEPAVPEAKEDEIIIIEKAEEVVPAQPPVAEEKPKDITYKIKWGDTLWDIADTYYKNPWRYKYIARYNGIKNPDYIISGTKIVIPAE